MNRNLMILNALLLAALAWAPMTVAQDAPEGEGPLVGKSDDDLEKEFTKLSGEVSKGMSELETEIARASLPPRKAAELEAELKAVLAKLKAGEAAKHEGLEAWLKENPDKLATLLGSTREDAEKLVQDSEALAKKLAEHSDGLSKLMDQADLVQSVLRRQLQIELSIREKMEKQAKLAKETGDKLEEIINIAYEMRARKPQKKGSGKPEDEQPGQDKQGSQGGSKPAPGGGQPSSPAPSEYQPGGGEKPEADKGNAERKIDGDAWNASKAKKAQEDANSSKNNDDTPSRYSGFKSKFNKAVSKTEGQPTAPAPAAPAAASSPAVPTPAAPAPGN